ncbi:MAG: flagellar basal body P-ring protein FlgI [Planctomycetota bacterium]|nr:flagellar basal body P-ring protein FlgI [Planctomycetota bacterium]
MGNIDRKAFCPVRNRVSNGVCVAATLLMAGFICGCPGQFKLGRGAKELAPQTELGATIGSLVEVVTPQSIPVEGYGLVGGLNGTGSSECPPRIRVYLTQYILSQLPGQKIDVEKLIDSPNTAVVLVEGVMPSIPLKGQYFDVKVTALEGTRTTSLQGGWLYGADLNVAGSFGIAMKVMVDAEGPVFIDKIDTAEVNKRVGYILAGGKVLDDFKIALVVRKPDYRGTSDIRNRVNELFGGDIARAVSPGRIEVTVPDKYREQKEKFVSLIKATYLAQTPQVTEERVKAFVTRLAVSQDKDASEIALEAIGNESLSKLGVLLNSSDQQVRLRAARCMLNLGSDAGLDVLRKMAIEKGSACRLEALEAIVVGASRNDAVAVSRRLLYDEDFDISLAAYEQLRKLEDVAITREFIGRNFYLERIAQTGHKAIFVSRSGQPRIVIFGLPIRCRGNIYVQSADGNVIINAPAGQKDVTLLRKQPRRSGVIARMKSSFELADIIRALCEEPAEKSEEARRGLGISYDEMIALLKQMCDRGAVKADFLAGPLPKIGLTIKK